MSMHAEPACVHCPAAETAQASTTAAGRAQQAAEHSRLAAHFDQLAADLFEAADVDAGARCAVTAYQHAAHAEHLRASSTLAGLAEQPVVHSRAA
jgi:hypothetical protein